MNWGKKFIIKELILYTIVFPIGYVVCMFIVSLLTIPILDFTLRGAFAASLFISFFMVCFHYVAHWRDIAGILKKLFTP